MRTVNKRSRELRHQNTGAKSFRLSNLFSSFFNSRKKSTTEKFSVLHHEERYHEGALSGINSLRSSFSISGLKKYFTHAGIIAVSILTIASNMCLDDNCYDIYSQSHLAKADAGQSDQLIEIEVDPSRSAQNIPNSQKIAQLAGSISDYSLSTDKKELIEQNLRKKNDEQQTDIGLIQNAYLEKANTPVTTVSNAPRKTIVMHIVKAGESLSSIADKYALSIDTLRWSNGMDNSGMVIEGQELYIMPMDGIYYTVREGDSLSDISEKYKSNLDEIRKWNNVPNDNIALGQKIILPGGSVPPPPKPVVTNNYVESSSDYSGYAEPDYSASPVSGSGSFGWPTSGMTITQYFGSTSFNPNHTGIDIDSRSGWDIFASDSGTVVTANYGWGGGYGNHVIIDHGNGYKTLYGHLSSLDVSVGENVGRGQRIGTMGSTGWSTGPHLHFEVRYNGSFLNPLNFL